MASSVNLLCKMRATEVQMSCTDVQADQHLIFATYMYIEQPFFLNPKFPASSHLVWLHSPICVGPGQKPPKQVFSCHGFNLNVRC